MKLTEKDFEILKGNPELVPVCAWCGKVRDEDGVWRKKGESNNRRSGVYMTHCVCAECARKFAEKIPF